jgi:hypothetical protein
MLRHFSAIAATLMTVGINGADDPVFSGPQVGEKLATFTMRGVFDKEAGQEFDVVKQANGQPLVLLFMHDANRPSIAFTRVLMNYVGQQRAKNLHGAVVWLAADASEAETALKRMRPALPTNVPIGISRDGKEGPGSYGLNRHVTLTVLVAKDNKVTANFALVQPSIQADLPKVLEQVAKVIGEKPPKLEDLPGVREMMATQPGRDEKLTALLRQLIRKDVNEEQVVKVAAEIEKYIHDKDAARKEVGRVAKTIVDGGKLENYGTPKAQEHLRRWAKEFGSKAPDPSKDR